VKNRRFWLLRTTDILFRRVSQTLKKEELSGTQFNVLRIFRGAPAGLSCGEIGNRMITRAPRYHANARPAGKAGIDFALPRN
jgi:hypothetical protein